MAGGHPSPGLWAAPPEARYTEQSPVHSPLPGAGSALPHLRPPSPWWQVYTAGRELPGLGRGGHTDRLTTGSPGAGLAAPARLPLGLQDEASRCKGHHLQPCTGSQSLRVETPTPSAGSCFPLSTSLARPLPPQPEKLGFFPQRPTFPTYLWIFPEAFCSARHPPVSLLPTFVRLPLIDYRTQSGVTASWRPSVMPTRLAQNQHLIAIC